MAKVSILGTFVRFGGLGFRNGDWFYICHVRKLLSRATKQAAVSDTDLSSVCGVIKAEFSLKNCEPIIDASLSAIKMHFCDSIS